MSSRQFKIIICILYSVLCTPIVYAVETIIVGEVINETTGEPIPNVNIHFRGTKVGTTSDEAGNYALRVDMQERAQLVFSAVGFFTQRFDIMPGMMSGLQVSLREKTATLTEIVVAPNENPALELLRQVREHRPDNDRTLHPETTATLQREQTLYVSHIQKKHLRRALWKSLQAGMIMQEDSTYIMPLYRETQSFRSAGPEFIPANDLQTQALILSSTDYSSLLGGEGNLNFYAHSVSLLGHAFLSPLASGGNLYYRFYINEEAINSVATIRDTCEAGRASHGAEEFIPENKLVRIDFRTRNPFYATFNGSMLIDTATFALRAITAYVPAEVAVNYVNTLHLSQTLAPDGSIADEHLSVILDFAVKSDQAGTIFPSLLLSTSLRAKDREFSANGMNSVATIRDTCEAGRASHGAEELHSINSTDSAFATLDSLPIIRTAKWFATIATTGYIPTGTPVDIGHIEEILQVNKHEGVHVGLPFRTNERFSKVVSLEASVGYGFKDRLPKGMGRISVNLPTPRKHYMQLEYNERYVWSEVDDFDRLLRENSMGWGNFDFTAYAFEALHRDSLCVNTAMRQRQLQFHWFADWTPHLETHAYVRAGWTLDAPYTVHLTPYAYQSLSLIARLSWGERKYDGFFFRRYAYSSKYPVLYLGAEFGHWNLTGEAGLYAHLRILLTQHAQLDMGGTLTYALQGGAIFGRVPLPLLWHASANQGYAYDPYRFTLLHGGELMADKYVALQAEWNGMGILFNLIPGIRWLHLRELAEFKLAYGYLSNSASGLTGGAGLTSNSPQGGLYTEVGIGIGNILRVADLYSVWGFTPLTSNRYYWGMRFRIHLGL